ncbi:DUF302 domain-containing protein [Methylobacterium sp. E-065]|uniref:DUF302 domain-containing protein n=1 Tax=Methylobacterium sp. E-065 TaxID=2836583 RepID=UPI001FB8B649|nr:DUF302 domain-containing protein [Methylobacterium sp. E-065]MCJ2016541.1 DUF302 domain-containing protein [Methylobacterium sp. E-065]
MSEQITAPQISSTQISSTQIAIEHVTLRSPKSFEAVRAALEASVPPLDHAYAKLLQDGQVDAARDLLERQAPLSIFGARDHGGLLLTAGLTRKAIQYDIGNPLTAARMTRHVLSAALYAPIRVLLREDAEGGVAFEYDRPATTFGQFGKHEVDSVAQELDAQLRTVLADAAG